MKRDTYTQLLRLLSIPFDRYPVFNVIAIKYGVDKASLMSIYSQEAQHRVIKTHHRLKASLPRLVARYLDGADIIELSFAANFPPCIVVRRLLEALPLGIGRQRITEVLRAPELLEAAAQLGGQLPGGRGEVCAGLLARLIDDVRRCVSTDHVYAPQCDTMRHESGVQYEELLYCKLQQLGAAFWSEEMLRAKGFFKTPDAKLQVPLAVRGRLVNWVDSKATFGDDRTHVQQLGEQFTKYINRYGPGAVIYWFGYVDDLDTQPDVLLLDGFPDPHDVTQLPALPLDLAGFGSAVPPAAAHQLPPAMQQLPLDLVVFGSVPQRAAAHQLLMAMQQLPPAMQQLPQQRAGPQHRSQQAEPATAAALQQKVERAAVAASQQQQQQHEGTIGSHGMPMVVAAPAVATAAPDADPEACATHGQGDSKSDAGQHWRSRPAAAAASGSNHKEEEEEEESGQCKGDGPVGGHSLRLQRLQQQVASSVLTGLQRLDLGEQQSQQGQQQQQKDLGGQQGQQQQQERLDLGGQQGHKEHKEAPPPAAGITPSALPSPSSPDLQESGVGTAALLADAVAV